jgi:hypothetical protein
MIAREISITASSQLDVHSDCAAIYCGITIFKSYDTLQLFTTETSARCDSYYVSALQICQQLSLPALEGEESYRGFRPALVLSSGKLSARSLESGRCLTSTKSGST